ncbi:MAG: AI-2E family transporter [Solirubrobacterales bacterium]
MRNPFAKPPAPTSDGAPVQQPTYVTLDRDAIETVFVAPKWLRDIGLTSWFAVGAALLLMAIIGILALTATIVIPLILAGVVAAVASPVVAWQQNHGVPRGVGTILFILLIGVISALFAYAVFSGIVSQKEESSANMHKASDNITNWLADHGVDPKAAKEAQKNAEQSTTRSASTLLEGIGSVVSSLTGIAFFLAMTFISLVFLLKDGPIIRRWTERHMGVPPPVANIITGRVIGSLRGYFFGVTIIAIFNAVVVGLGAFVLNVPLVATIMLVTFIGAYIPFLGAWAAGAFSVLIAFGAGTNEAVIGMIIIQLLANGVLQQMVQPIAYGAALGIHPLAALVATIGGGGLFGAVGLILGAPMVSAFVRISSDLANARAEEAATAPDPPPDLATGLPVV